MSTLHCPSRAYTELKNSTEAGKVLELSLGQVTSVSQDFSCS